MAIYTIRKSLFNPDRKYQSLKLASYKIPVVAKPGMVLINPTSIAFAGTSATKGTNGQITFNAVTSLSLNEIFSNIYENYVISMEFDASADQDINIRYRASGVDASGANYSNQYLSANGATIAAGRVTAQTGNYLTNIVGSYRNGVNATFYGPFLVQPTVLRSLNIYPQSGARIVDYAGIHSISASYDGITLIPTLSNITGTLQVYGVRR